MTAKEYGLTMSQWDRLSQDDKDWCLASRIPPATCPVCGGENPDDTCQNPDLAHTWFVQWEECFKTRAIIDAVEQRKKAKDKYLQGKNPRAYVLGSLLDDGQREVLADSGIQILE